MGQKIVGYQIRGKRVARAIFKAWGFEPNGSEQCVWLCPRCCRELRLRDRKDVAAVAARDCGRFYRRLPPAGQRGTGEAGSTASESE